MDKYKVILKIEETKRLASEKKYKEAYEEMKYLNLAKMKNYEDLIIFADIFVRNKKYVEAKELLERLHMKTVTRRLLTQLIFVSAKTKNFVDAEKYYEEYVRIAPKDINKYILRYRIDKEKGLSKDVLIKTLEELKEYDYVEEWAYELAKLYHKAGRSKECIRECSNIELWFGDGITVEKAKLLREHHINALSDEPLGKLSNEVMDFTATGKLIDILGIIPQTKSEEDAFAYNSEFEKDNDKVDEDNRRFMPNYKEDNYSYDDALGTSGGLGSEMKEISSDVTACDMDNGLSQQNQLSEEQVDEMPEQIIDDKPNIDDIQEEDNVKKTHKHKSFIEAFKNMMAIRDFDDGQEDEELQEESDDIKNETVVEAVKEEIPLVVENKVLDDKSDSEKYGENPEDNAHDQSITETRENQEQIYEEVDEEAEDESLKVQLTDEDFDPQLLELEQIIAQGKSEREIEAEAKNVARDIRKDLASEISTLVEEEEKVRSEFKEDMQELESMATKRIVSVEDILEKLEENNRAESEEKETQELECKEGKEKETNEEMDVREESGYVGDAEVEPESTNDVKPQQESEDEDEREDEHKPVVDEAVQRENVDEVLAKTSIPVAEPQITEKAVKEVKVSEELFRSFAKNDYLNETLTKAFALVNENKICANFIISGDRKTGKSTLGKMITKQLKDMGALNTGKVARIDAARFNNVDLELKQDSLVDCCLIINNAHEISPYAITGLISMLIKFGGRTMVILETNQKADVILGKTSEVSAYFSNVIEMPKYSVDDLIYFGESYANLNEYRINDSAVFALRNILDERIESISQTEAVESVIDILDNAMISAQNRNRNKLKEILTLKTTDFEGFNEIDMQDIMPL